MNMIINEILLRRPEPKDVEMLYNYRNDWNVISFLVGFSYGYSIKDIQDWMESHRKRNDEIIWVIAEKESDRCIGHVGLYNIDHRIRCADFGIMIGDKGWWNRGLGKKICHSVIDYGFKNLNLHRIKLSVLETNTRAISLYEKLGFKKEGIMRHEQFRYNKYIDVIVMGILEDEWQV